MMTWESASSIQFESSGTPFGSPFAWRAGKISLFSITELTYIEGLSDFLLKIISLHRRWMLRLFSTDAQNNSDCLGVKESADIFTTSMPSSPSLRRSLSGSFKENSI